MLGGRRVEDEVWAGVGVLARRKRVDSVWLS